jgi:hypothetical protein
VKKNESGKKRAEGKSAKGKSAKGKSAKGKSAKERSKKKVKRESSSNHLLSREIFFIALFACTESNRIEKGEEDEGGRGTYRASHAILLAEVPLVTLAVAVVVAASNFFGWRRGGH